MRIILFAALILLFTSAASQQQEPTPGSKEYQFKYYFLQLKATGKADVLIYPEMESDFSDIDSLIVSAREPGKKEDKITYRVYKTYSDAFSTLSAAGLEFVGFVSLPTVGGGTQFLAGDIRFTYSVWRKKL